MNRFAFLLLAVTMVAVACGQSATPASTATKVTATLSDKDITLSVPSVSAGTVSFKIVNNGTVVHSIVLLKTDLPADKLPADPKDASKVQETGSVFSTGPIAVGQSKDMTRTLASGNYVVVCNEPAHYLIGMHVPFTVK